MNIITSNKHMFAKAIVDKILTVDFRKSFNESLKGSICYIYASAPVKKVIGYATIQDVIKITDGTFPKSYITNLDKLFLAEHLKFSKKGYVLCFSNVHKYRIPKDISEFGIKKAPMSWCYVKE